MRFIQTARIYLLFSSPHFLFKMFQNKYIRNIFIDLCRKSFQVILGRVRWIKYNKCSKLCWYYFSKLISTLENIRVTLLQNVNKLKILYKEMCNETNSKFEIWNLILIVSESI